MQLLNDAMTSTRPTVTFLNYAFHFLSLKGAREISRDVFMHYESTIEHVLQNISAVESKSTVVWMLTNSVCTNRFTGAYRQAVHLYRRGNRTWFAEGANDWKHVALSAFDREGARLLNNRAELYLREHHSHIRIVDGFSATDFMCNFTKEHDGRHFPELRPLKLDLFFHAVRHLLPRYELTDDIAT